MIRFLLLSASRTDGSGNELSWLLTRLNGTCTHGFDTGESYAGRGLLGLGLGAEQMTGSKWKSLDPSNRRTSGACMWTGETACQQRRTWLALL